MADATLASSPTPDAPVPRIPGRLAHTGGSTFTLHTRAAQRLVTERSEAPTLFQAANALYPIYELTATNNVIADACLVDVDHRLRLINDDFDLQKTGIEQLYAERQQSGLSHADTASISPRSYENTDFGTPYGYALLALVAKYDTLARQLLGAGHVALITRPEMLERINTRRQHILKLFRGIDQYSRTVKSDGINQFNRPMSTETGDDSKGESRVSTAWTLCESIGLSLTDAIVHGTQRPDFYMPLQRNTSTTTSE